MEFQVVVPGKSVRPIHVGNVRIHFFGKGHFESSEMTDVKTPTGYEKVSTPETTAWDLVRYAKHSGGLENVITVLSELSEKLDAKKLLATAKKHDDILTAQRLGWLLESLKEKDLAKGLADWVGKRNPPMRPLEPGSPLEGSKENERWHLLINAKPVPEA
jgi:predicted transcriptional regulator of viral defense system